MQNLVIFGDTQFAERIYKYIKIEQAFNVLAFTPVSYTHLTLPTTERV